MINGQRSFRVSTIISVSSPSATEIVLRPRLSEEHVWESRKGGRAIRRLQVFRLPHPSVVLAYRFEVPEDRVFV